jgi:large repetitive protein
VYAIFLINNGPGQATNVVWTDALPSSVTFLAIEAPENWTCNTPQVDTTGIVNCSNSGVAAGETVGFTLTVRPTIAGVITNTVSTTTTEPDTNMENNTQTQQTTVITTDTPG